MATQRTSFSKMQRDRDKQAKAAAKRDRRQERQAEAAAGPTPSLPSADDGSEISPGELLSLVESVHQQFESGVIDFDTFEETKASLLSRLPVD
jgi:hypothetical protein